jgi:hypothetical protein
MAKRLTKRWSERLQAWLHPAWDRNGQLVWVTIPE